MSCTQNSNNVGEKKTMMKTLKKAISKTFSKKVPATTRIGTAGSGAETRSGGGTRG